MTSPEVNPVLFWSCLNNKIRNMLVLGVKHLSIYLSRHLSCSLRARGELHISLPPCESYHNFCLCCNIKLCILSSSCSQCFLQHVSRTGVPGAGDWESLALGERCCGNSSRGSRVMRWNGRNIVGFSLISSQLSLASQIFQAGMTHSSIMWFPDF